MSKSEDERNEHIRRMQEKAEAELKAKLDMVDMKQKPTYGRHPKKIGEMICSTGVKSGYSEATAKFVLRLDTSTGEFIAEHGDTWYVSKSRDALKAKMDKVARVTYDLKWTRYIKVEYKAEVPCSDSWRRGRGTTTLDLGDRRDKGGIIYGMSLEWEVVEYSDPITLPGEDTPRYMFREVNNGHPSEEQKAHREMPTGLVVYTKEREAMLKKIRQAFASIDQKMVSMFHGTPTHVAKQLDSMTGTLLLEAPKKEKKR